MLTNSLNMQNVIEIHRPPLPVYQSVIEKTRGLALRTQAMGTALVRAPIAQPLPTETQPVVVDGAR
jgi:translation initiation factor 3 subunit E